LSCILMDNQSASPTPSATKPKYSLLSGAHEAQGRRETMEDAHQHFDNLKQESGFESLNNFSQIAYYAVFDGHGGDQTAKMVEKQLHPIIFKTDEFNRGDVKGAITKGFEEMDKIVVEEANKLNMMHGSTSVVAMVMDGTLFVANIGDSEGILVSVQSQKVSVQNLTRPHKANDPTEKERIESLGGHVFFGRVFGALAVSRSFGDAKYKKPKTSKDFVSWEPEIQAVELQPAHKYLILACDGLWDVINHQQAAELTHRCFLEGQTPQQVAKTLVKTALQRKTEDNVTVVVAKLQWEGILEEAPPSLDESPPTTDSTESEESGDDGGDPSSQNSPGASSQPGATTNTTTTATTTTTETTSTSPTASTTSSTTETPSDVKMEEAKAT